MKIQPEMQFPHGLSHVAALAERYGIVSTGYSEASSGIENTTLVVEGSASRYAFRIYRQGKKSIGSIQAELDFMEYLRCNGVPIPRLLPNQHDQFITSYTAFDTNWQVIVMEFVDAEHVTTFGPSLLADIAHTQARIHLLAAKYDAPTQDIRTIHRLAEREFIPQIDQSELSLELRQFLKRGADFSFELTATLPSGVCHMDYDQLNLLCKDDRMPLCWISTIYP